MEPAARITVTEVQKFLEANSQIERVYLVCFGQRAYNIYHSVLNAITAQDKLHDTDVQSR